MYCENDKSIARTIRAVSDALPAPCSIDPNHIKLLANRFNSFKHFDRENEQTRCTEFFSKPFTQFVLNSVGDNVASQEGDQPVQADQMEKVPDPSTPSSRATEQVEIRSTTGSSPFVLGSEHVTPVVKCKHGRDQLTPRKAKIKKRLDFVAKMRSSEKKVYLRRIKCLKNKVNVQRYAEIKYLNQDITRKKKSMKLKDATITLLKRQLNQANNRTTCDCDRKQKAPDYVKLNRNHERLKKARAKKQKKIDQLLKEGFVSREDHLKVKEELRQKNDMIRSLQNQILELEEQLNESESKDKHTKKDRKTYNVETRMTVYNAIVNQVATKNIPNLIGSHRNLCNETVSSVPQRSTVDQMVRELDAIADLKAAELVMKQQNLTLGFDATTQEGTHINSIHLTTESECEVVDIAELAGGTADDYHDHITKSVDQLAQAYSDFHHEEYGFCREGMISNISNTLTDRVSVNHATIRKVNETWGKTLNELNCHLHPLDTIASTCRSALKGLESTKGHLFGKDCMAGNLVLQINKFRYKDGKGDPKGFKTFLDEKQLPRGLIPRYRGNRLHILFHIAGILYQHYDAFLELFTTGSVSCGGLQSSIRKDFQNPTTVLEIHALGLLGKLLTGPWMQVFYTAAGGEVSHVEGIRIVKDVVCTLKQVSADPLTLMSRNTDFFGRPLTKGDTTLDALKVLREGGEDQFQVIMKTCIDAVIAVLERQYKRYFDMDITRALEKETASARLHNIDAEEVVGMYSALKERSKNARIDFLRGKMRAKKNCVIPYLENLCKATREKVIDWAVGWARQKRKESRNKQDELKEELIRRAALKIQKKNEHQRKEVEKKLKSVDLSDLGIVFPDLDDVLRADLGEILSGTVVGRNIMHTWYDEDNNSKTLFYGKIEKLRKRKGVQYYTVAYWKDGETYDDDAEDSLLTKYELGADLIDRDLIFC